MEEKFDVTLEQAQQDLINELYHDPEDGNEGEGESWNLQQFEAISKALAEQRKAENEKLRIEAESARAAKEAEVADQRSRRELIGNGLRAAGQIGAAGIAGFVAIVQLARILDGEEHDVLALSKAMGFVLKPRS